MDNDAGEEVPNVEVATPMPVREDTGRAIS